MTIIGDNGPDMNPTSYVNIFYLGRLWRDINLTKLTAITYPAGRSAYNPIEHAWSPLSNRLTSVILPATLDGEDQPPCKQSGLTKEKLKEKSAKMLDIAAEQLTGYWKHLSYDGHAVAPVVIKSLDETGHYKDHADIIRLIYATFKAQEEDKELAVLVKEFKMLAYHADRRSNFISFNKCQLLRPGKECDWCHSHPPQPCNALEYEKQLRGLWYDPMPSADHPGHFMTYLEMDKAGKFDYQQDLFEIGKCSICINWWFSSKTEVKRHRRLFHPRVPMNKIVGLNDGQEILPESNQVKKRHVCNHKECGLSFPTYDKLLVHKNRTGHKQNRKRKANADKIKEAAAEKKRNDQSQSLLHFFNKNTVQEEPRQFEDRSDDDNDDECEAGNDCKIAECEDDDFDWVQCDTCCGWWHLFCLNLSALPKTFKCKNCL